MKDQSPTCQCSIKKRASNVDRLRLLGNGVYPAVAAKAFVTLFEKLRKVK